MYDAHHIRCCVYSLNPLFGLTRISHTFSEQIAALLTEIAVQMGEAVLLEHCPHPSEQQSQSAERRSVQKKCEKSGLTRNKGFGESLC
jgi:hypothetical protein